MLLLILLLFYLYNIILPLYLYNTFILFVSLYYYYIYPDCYGVFVSIATSINSVGAAVKLAESRGIPLDQLSLEDLQGLHSGFQEDVAAVWSYEHR